MTSLHPAAGLVLLGGLLAAAGALMPVGALNIVLLVSGVLLAQTGMLRQHAAWVANDSGQEMRKALLRHFDTKDAE